MAKGCRLTQRTNKRPDRFASEGQMGSGKWQVEGVHCRGRTKIAAYKQKKKEKEGKWKKTQWKTHLQFRKALPHN